MTLRSVRAKINAGEEGYKVTAASAPAFLYEDPAKYDPEHVLSGFMRGYFLARVCGSLINPDDTNSFGSACKRYSRGQGLL